MKRNTKYVGLDVHQAMTVATVRSEGGRVIARSVVETSDESIRELGSTPLERTLQRRPILGQEECHGKAKEVQRGV